MFDKTSGLRDDHEASPAPLGARTRWETQPTGPATIAALARQSLAGLSAADLLDVVTAWERQSAWLAEQQARAIAAAAAKIRTDADADYGDAEMTENLVAAEIGTALRLSPTSAGRRVAVSEDLSERLPATAEALSNGRVSYWQAMVIATGTMGLTGEQARLIEERVLPTAANTTAAGLRKRIERARLVLNPRDSSERARQAVEHRTVTMVPAEDGMAELRAYGPAPQVQALWHALDIAAGRTGKRDGRLIGARRFDALIDAGLRCLDKPLCPPPAKVPATVHLTMDLPTLFGLAEHPGELQGYGPLPAPIARMLAADNDWRRLVHDPITGAPVDLGRLKRKPSAELARWVRARDAICLFPGCFRAAVCCDLDHRIRVVDHGPTNEQNLAPLCPKHHRVKEHGWRYQRFADRIVWRSREGRRYTRYLHEAHHDLIALLAAAAPDYEPADIDGFAAWAGDTTGYEKHRSDEPPDGFPPPDIDQFQGDEPTDEVLPPDLLLMESFDPPEEFDGDRFIPPEDPLCPHAIDQILPPDGPEPPESLWE